MDLQCYRVVIGTFACKLSFILARKAARLPNHPNLLKRKEKPRANHYAVCGQHVSGLNHDAGDGGIVFTILLVFAAGVLMFASPCHTHSIGIGMQ